MSRHSSTPPDSKHQQSELQLLRQRLFRLQPDIQDESLWKEISIWLYGTADSGQQGSLESHVRGELAALTEADQHKMYPHVDVDQPEDAFPDRCEGCEHYGVACPVLADHTGKQHLKRTYDVAEGDDDLASQLFELANQYGCHVLSAVVSERREGMAAQKKKGHELYNRAITNAQDWDDDAPGITADLFDELDADPSDFGIDPDTFEDDDGVTTPATSSQDGSEDAHASEPPETTRSTVEAVSAAVDARDEEEAEGD